MRHHFQTQPDLQLTPIEMIRLPLRSRDELPPILAGLQWLWRHPTLKPEILALIAAKILAGKKATGRTGMDLWQILALGAKVHASLLELCDQPVDLAHWEALAYFHAMLAQHLDLVERRLLKEETIPAHEKVFSLFEPHTEWIQKGKQRPNVELGHKLLIATDQNQLIQDYAVLLGEAEVDQSIPVADRLLGRHGAGSVASLSFDKGFTREEDRQLLGLYIPEVVMPKRGKKNAAEMERESGKKFVALRKQHSAVESEINSLEHHGLNRCPDVGLGGYLRYAGLGVLSYNLHVIGRELLARERARAQTARAA